MPQASPQPVGIVSIDTASSASVHHNKQDDRENLVTALLRLGGETCACKCHDSPGDYGLWDATPSAGTVSYLKADVDQLAADLNRELEAILRRIYRSRIVEA